MKKLKVALFDVDGVLLDSLTPHLKICEDKNREYGLGLKIPDAVEFKEMVRHGTRISPMKYFFTAVGFPEELAEKANLQYQEVFMQKYAPMPFPDTYPMLRALHESGLQLGIVTSNVKANVVDALGPSMQFFPPRCIFSKDDGFSKSEAIAAAVATLQAVLVETVYVGDQPADWEAAKKAGVNFLGVAYGWGISEHDKDFPVASHVGDVYRCIASWQGMPEREQVRPTAASME